MRTRLTTAIAWSIAMTAALAAHAAPHPDLPAAWLARWRKPAATDRPLQIIHGIDPSGRGAAGMAQMVKSASPDELAEAGMRAYAERGLGGVVCNVMFQDYLRSEPAWTALVAGIGACRKLGLVAWIYDESGYPSGSAGGLTLEGRPEYEAQALAYDAAKADPFVVRPAYEFTHASNNYAAARRYINLIDDRAVRRFIEVTHQAYRKRLGAEIGSTVHAFFTDEPSLITVNLGQIPESARKNVPIQDPLDPTVKPLPSVPWVYDLPEQYRRRYHRDIMAERRSLFVGDTEADSAVRTRFWSLIADLVADRFYGQIRTWCRAAGVASSGHNLWEEAIMHHPTLYGNGLKALSRMDIPGLDELSSNPDVVINGHWMTAALPASAALLNGGRRVFTEVSDFSEQMSGAGNVGVPEMQCAASWQAAFGVTDFTLYYGIQGRTVEQYRAYCDHVGRLNAILKDARPDPDVLLYYPIHDLWAEYRPMAEPLDMGRQTERARRIVGSFSSLGGALTRNQAPFCLVDHDFLAGASVRSDGRLMLKGRAFRAIALPEGVVLPPAAARVVARFEAKGGLVLRDTAAQRLAGDRLRSALKPEVRLAEASSQVVLGRFVRNGRQVLLAVNVSRAAYSGALEVARQGQWTQMDPATGQTGAAAVTGNSIALTLAPRQTVLLVGPKG